MDERRKMLLHQFEKRIGYNFKNIELLDIALTHSSFVYGNEKSREHNERLEFLGDSILSMIISLYLYQTMRDMPEGQLTRIRANVVCEQSLYYAANSIKIGDFISLSKGEENTGGRKRASILADTFEALIAAIYLDGGIRRARKFVLSITKDIIEASINDKIFNDYKSYIQEHVQKNNLGSIAYKIMSETGPDHLKEFKVGLFIDNKIMGQGKGHSKKDAQQSAAKAAVTAMGLIDE